MKETTYLGPFSAAVMVDEIGKKYSHKYSKYTITVLASNWSNSNDSYINSLTVPGVTAKSDIQIVPLDTWTTEQRNAWIIAEIISGSQNIDTVILRASGAMPTVDFDIDILVGGDVL